MNYKGQIGYYLIFAFWAEKVEMLGTHLLASDKHSWPKASWFFKQAIATAPEGRPLALRADSDFYIRELIEFCERFKPRPILCAIPADQTKGLMRRSLPCPKKAEALLQRPAGGRAALLVRWPPASPRCGQTRQGKIKELGRELAL